MLVRWILTGGGVMVLTLTILLGVGRQVADQEDRGPLLLTRQASTGATQVAYEVFALDIPFHRVLTTTSSDISSATFSADGNSVYWLDYPYMNVPSPYSFWLNQLSVGGGPIEQQRKIPGVEFLWSRDRRWMFYFASDPNDNYNQHIYQARVDGSDVLKLTGALQQSKAGEQMWRGHWSLFHYAEGVDGDWVYFTTIDPQNQVHLYRVRTNTPELQHIVGPLESVLFRPLADSDWIFYPPGYLVRRDGQQVQTILSEEEGRPPINSNGTLVSIGGITWLPKLGVLLLIVGAGEDLTMTALRPGEQGWLWELPYTGKFATSPDGEWIYLLYDDKLVQMRADGTAQKELPVPAKFVNLWGVAPDGESYFYTRHNLDGPITERDQVRWRTADGTIDRLLAIQARNFGMLGWSPDQRWIIFSAYGNGLFAARADGSEWRLLAIAEPDAGYQIMAWSTREGFAWQPAPLIFWGAALLITSIGLSRWRRQKSAGLA